MANNSLYQQSLPQAYWKEEDKYKNIKGKEVECKILDRYNGNAVVKNSFVEFINEINQLAVQEKSTSWFDAKQETCHLLGIVFYALQLKAKKPIHFFNVAANYKKNDRFAESFRSKAEKMMKIILKEKSVSFEYKLFSVRAFFEENQYLDNKGYESDRTVRQLISDRSLYSEQPIL